MGGYVQNKIAYLQIYTCTPANDNSQHTTMPDIYTKYASVEEISWKKESQQKKWYPIHHTMYCNIFLEFLVWFGLVSVETGKKGKTETARGRSIVNQMKVTRKEWKYEKRHKNR